MKKLFVLFVIPCLVATHAFAEEVMDNSTSPNSAETSATDSSETMPPPPAPQQTPDMAQTPASMPSENAAVEPAPAPVTEPATEVSAEAANDDGEPSAENLEFISGEISSVDETAQTITVKLYGESDDASNDKILTVKLDSTTDITDGEKDRDLKSLTPGTEVDVEYDSTSNKATYIFVY
jgi:hypothetical protein